MVKAVTNGIRDMEMNGAFVLGIMPDIFGPILSEKQAIFSLSQTASTLANWFDGDFDSSSFCIPQFLTGKQIQGAKTGFRLLKLPCTSTPGGTAAFDFSPFFGTTF